VNNDRLLNILRWVVTPIALAAITGYFQVRVTAAKEQTRATYDTLAPNVLQLQEQVATLTGRLEELARRPVLVSLCPEGPKAASKPAMHVEAPPTKSPKAHPLTLEEMLSTGKVEPMIDMGSPASAPAAGKVPAKFDDMIQQQQQQQKK
jgi:hypothetical protein